MASFIYNSRNHSSEEFWRPSPPHIPNESDRCIVKLLEWPSAQSLMSISVKELLERRPKQLRIISGPLDFVNPESPERSHGLQAIYKHFCIPTEFILERLHSVTHSFGSYTEEHRGSRAFVCWAHSLSKNIVLHFDENGTPFIRDPRGSSQRHGDWTWLRSGYFLRWNNYFADDLKDMNVTLVIFSPSPDLTLHLHQLVSRPDWRQGVMDPFGLLVLVVEGMFQEVSTTINKVLRVLRHTEYQVLCAAGETSTEPVFDFVGLHNISKHVIDLLEGCQAANALAKHIYDAHQNVMTNVSCPERLEIMRSVHGLLLHKCTLLEGLALRVTGMKDRTQNITNLAFNTVNQRDSDSLKDDSQAMKVIANMTILFLPSSTLATIFGSAFFNFNADSQKVVMAKNFGMFWASAIPLSLGVVYLSYLWYSRANMSLRRRRAGLLKTLLRRRH